MGTIAPAGVAMRWTAGRLGWRAPILTDGPWHDQAHVLTWGGHINSLQRYPLGTDGGKNWHKARLTFWNAQYGETVAAMIDGPNEILTAAGARNRQGVSCAISRIKIPGKFNLPSVRFRGCPEAMLRHIGANAGGATP